MLDYLWLPDIYVWDMKQTNYIFVLDKIKGDSLIYNCFIIVLRYSTIVTNV